MHRTEGGRGPHQDHAHAAAVLAAARGIHHRPRYEQRQPRGPHVPPYRYEPDKFGHARLTAVPSTTVTASRVAECPVHLEATVTDLHVLGGGAGGAAAVELAVTHVHVDESLRLAGTANRIDP